MPTPTEFELKCTAEAIGDSPWPDLSAVKWIAPETVEVRSCVRCKRPVDGNRCPHCRAHQDSYQ